MSVGVRLTHDAAWPLISCCDAGQGFSGSTQEAVPEGCGRTGTSSRLLRRFLINQFCALQPAIRCISHRVGYSGVRVGEAAHPGPGRATQKWKKAAQQQAAQLKQVLSLLQALLGCIKGGQGMPDLGSIFAGASSIDGPRPGPKAKAKAKAKAKSTSRAPAPHQPPEPSSTTANRPADPVTAVGLGSPQVPKTRRQAPQQASQKAGQTEARIVYALRPGDWHGVVLPYANLEQELRTRGSGPIVVLAGSAQEADVAAQLVAARGRHAAWILHRERDAQLTVPMTSGGQLRPQHVCCQTVPCTGVAFPSLKSAPRPKAAPTNATCPMRVIVCSSLAAEDLWKTAASQPRRFLQDWVKLALPGQLRGVVQDSWGFAEGLRSGNKVITGLIRISTSVVTPLLAVSGRHGVFLEPVAHHPAYPAAVVDWQRPAAGESWAKLCQRLCDQRPAYGLVLGGRQLGLRRAPGADYTPKALWQVVGTPVHWGDGFLHDLILDQTPAKSAEILRRQVRGRRCTWWVRAAIPGGEDAHCLVAAEGDREINVWLLPSTAKPPPRKPGRPIAQQGAFPLFRAPFDQVDKPSTASAPAGDVDIDLDAEGDGGTDARPSPPPKRSAANFTARLVPEGAQVHVVPGDGACFFHAVSRALEVLHDRKVSAAQARAETVAHLRRYQDAYVEFWDRTDDRGQGVENWVDYLVRMASADAWAGHLELVACAKTLRICLLILPEDASRVTCCFGNPAHPPVALFHTRNHYDLLLPSEGTVYPGVIMDIAKEGPDRQIPRAGSSAPYSAPSGFASGAGRGRPRNTPSLASSAPTAYRLARHPSVPPQGDEVSHPHDLNHGGDIDVPVDRAPHAVASACASVHGPARGSIQHYFGGAAPAPTTPEMIADLPDPPSPPPPPRVGSRGRLLKPKRCPKVSWKCEWCDFVAKAPHGADKLATHVRQWHPEHLQSFKRPKLPEFRVPAGSDVVEWPCPCCDRALIRTDPPQSPSSMLLTRLKHRREHHPTEPKAKFLLKSAKSNALKATRAVIAAATARRLLKHRSGGFGNHPKVEFYRIPFLGSRVKKARSSRMVYVCTTCLQTADTPNRIKALTCARVTRSSSRVCFIARLRKCLSTESGVHQSELLDGARALLNRLTGDTPAPRRFTGKRKPPPAVRKHDILALAWPTVWRHAYTFRLRFVCTACLANQSTRSNLEQRPCGPTVRGAAARLRRQLDAAAASADVIAVRTARLALHALGHLLPVAAPELPAPPVVASLADVGTDGLRDDTTAPPAPRSDNAVVPSIVPALTACASSAPSGLCVRPAHDGGR